MSTEATSTARWRLGLVLAELQRVRTGPQRPLAALQAVRHAEEALADVRDLLTTAARSEGASWGQIGRALGISRQAARQAGLRHLEHQEQRQLAVSWNMPMPRRRRRFRWPLRRSA